MNLAKLEEAIRQAKADAYVATGGGKHQVVGRRGRRRKSKPPFPVVPWPTKDQ